MPKVTLARRWGKHKAGSTVDVSESRAAFLLGIGWAADSLVMNAAGVRPGENGPDPVVSGDPTRRRPSITRPERDDSVNRAEPHERAPRVRRPVAPAATPRIDQAEADQEQDAASSRSKTTRSRKAADKT